MNDKPVLPSSNPAVPTRPEAQWVMIFNLYIKQGKEEIKKTYKVNKKRLVIGSALSSDIRIQQNAISNVHAVVEIEENGKATIFDMASETGVFVNDKKIVNEDLKDGDEVKIGFATLTFKKVSVSDEQKTVAPAAMSTTGSGRKLFYDAKEDFRPLILEDERNIIQIFDYPNATEQCLQVVMYWGDVILDVAHIVGNEKVTLGESRKNTFTVPGLHTELELAAPEGSMTMLSVTGEMTGVIRSGNKMVPLEDMGSKRFHLKQNDLAKIQFREITFFLSYSPVPPHLRRQRVLERDPLYMQIWFSSVGLTLAFVVLMASLKIEKPLDPEEVKPEIVVKIFKPEPPKPIVVKPPPVEKTPEPPKPPVKPPEPPKPPKVVKPPTPPKVIPKPKEPPKAIDVKTKPSPTPVHQVKGETPKPVGANANKAASTSGGNKGEGAKHVGAEGAKGDPNKPKTDVHMKSSKGNPRNSVPTKSQVQGEGNVEAMFSDISGNLAKSMAASGAGARGAVDNARSYDPYTTGGAGGAGQVGTGAGGGGNSRTAEGMGKQGFGGGDIGKGLGTKGTGGSLLGTGSGGGGRPSVEFGDATETVIMGGLDKSIIDEYIKRHMRLIRGCYERQLNSSPKLRGRITTRFVISGSGRVSQAGVTGSEIANAAVESCLLGVLKRIEFPEPLGGGVVEVDYPFNFTPSIGG